MDAETNRRLARHHRAIAYAHGEIVEGMHRRHPQRPHHGAIEDAHRKIAEILEDAAEPERQPGDTWCGIGELDDRFPNSTACDRMHGRRRPGQDPKMRGVPAIITKCKHCGELLTEPEPDDGGYSGHGAPEPPEPTGEDVAVQHVEPAATPERPRPMLCVHHGGGPDSGAENLRHGFVCPTCYGGGVEPPEEPAEAAEELPPLSERVGEYLVQLAVYYPGFTAQERSTLVDAIRELEARPPRDATCGGCRRGSPGGTWPVPCEVIGENVGFCSIACVKIERKETT